MSESKSKSEIREGEGASERDKSSRSSDGLAQREVVRECVRVREGKRKREIRERERERERAVRGSGPVDLIYMESLVLP